MKKSISTLIALAVLATNSAYAIDLNELWNETATWTSGTTVASTGTVSETTSTGSSTASSAKTLSKIQIIPEVPSIVADGKRVVQVAVRVSTESDEALAPEDVELVAEIVWNDADKSMGTFNTWAYSEEQKYFEFNYVAGTKAWDVQLKVTATSKSNKMEISQVEKIVLTADSSKTSEVPEVTVATTTSSESVKEVSSTGTASTSSTGTESVSSGSVNVVKTEVLDGNRIKVSFDKEIALADNPLEMVSIENVKDKSKVELTNVTLGQDKKSLVIFSKDALKKEEYHVIVNTVVDGKTMKSVSVANGTTTVSGMSEVVIVILAVLASLFAVAMRRKTA